MASCSPSCRPSSFSFLLKILVITIATLSALSITMAIAKDAPEMSATIPIGPCESQPFPYQNTTAEQTSNEETNRPQNASPIVLTFSRMDSPIDRAMLVSQPRILLPLYPCTYRLSIDLTLRWYGVAHNASSSTGTLSVGPCLQKNPDLPVLFAKPEIGVSPLTPLRAGLPR